MDDILFVLGVALLFSIRDLSSGYWQVEVHLADREKAVFMVPPCTNSVSCHLGYVMPRVPFKELWNLGCWQDFAGRYV